MKKLNLFIDKDEVLLEVARITNYEGAKASQQVKEGLTEANGTPYSQIFTADADNDILENYWQEACMNAASKMDYYISGVSVGKIPVESPEKVESSELEALKTSAPTFYNKYKDTTLYHLTEKEKDGLDMDFDMPSNYTDVVIELIKGNLKLSLANYIVGNWFSISYPQKSEYYFTKADAQLTATRDLLFRRNRPTQRDTNVPERSSVSLSE